MQYNWKFSPIKKALHIFSATIVTIASSTAIAQSTTYGKFANGDFSQTGSNNDGVDIEGNVSWIRKPSGENVGWEFIGNSGIITTIGDPEWILPGYLNAIHKPLIALDEFTAVGYLFGSLLDELAPASMVNVFTLQSKSIVEVKFLQNTRLGDLFIHIDGYLASTENNNNTWSEATIKLGELNPGTHTISFSVNEGSAAQIDLVKIYVSGTEIPNVSEPGSLFISLSATAILILGRRNIKATHNINAHMGRIKEGLHK